MWEIRLHAPRRKSVNQIVRLVFVLMLCLFVSGPALANGREARRVAEQARKALKEGRIVQAYLLYSQAVVLEPANVEWLARAQALRARAILLSREGPVQVPLALPGEPAVIVSAETADEPAHEAPVPPEALPPPRLKHSERQRDLDLRGDARSLFTQVAQLYQLEAVFDSDYPPSQAMTFRLDNAGWLEAIRALENATASFVVPLSESRFLVARDTPQKRQEREPHITVAVPVPDLVTAQDAQEIRAAVQQVMQITRIGFDPARRLIVFRDRASLAEPARILLEQLLNRKPVVSVEVELVEVNRQFFSAFGASLATSYLVTNFGRLWNSPPQTVAGFANFAVFGGGKTLLGFGIPDVQMVAQSSRSNGRNLVRVELRSLDGQAASLHLGERFPVVTAKEILPTPDSPATYPPTFNYEDLGLVIKATPRVHGHDEVTLTLEASFKALTGQFIDEIPVVSNRSFQSEVRLRTGEWAIVAGLVTSSEARTITGLEGLTRIPVLNRLAAANRREDSHTTILMLVRPRLLGLPIGEKPSVAIPIGAELRPRVPL